MDKAKRKDLKDALRTYLETLRTHFADSERAPDWGFGALDYAFGAGIVTAKEYESMKKQLDRIGEKDAAIHT